MAKSQKYLSLRAATNFLEGTYLDFKSRTNGNYNRKELSAAAAYTVFCHAEIEAYLESWATELTELASQSWTAGRATKPLVHLCTFHEGRGNTSNVPPNDIWNEVVIRSINKHKKCISDNHGIKEGNVCLMFSPLGFDTRNIDPILLSDLSSFGASRGNFAHKTHKSQIKQIFDPFDTKKKVGSLVQLFEVFDDEIRSYFKLCKK